MARKTNTPCRMGENVSSQLEKEKHEAAQLHPQNCAIYFAYLAAKVEEAVYNPGFSCK